MAQRLRLVPWSLAATLAGLIVQPHLAWASHRVAGEASWQIPWYATALLVAAPYAVLLAVGLVVYRLLGSRGLDT